MNLKSTIEEYFASSSYPIFIKTLIKKNGITYENIEELLDILYELEKEGKIIWDGNGSYMRVFRDYYLKWGIVKKSAQGNFYIKLPKGEKVLLEDKNLKEDDVVFVSTKKGNHPKLLIGKVKRIVQRPQFEIPNFMFKAEVKRSKKHNSYYVELNNKRYYIKDLNGAYKGDIVTIVGSIKDGKHIADVKEIVKRKTQMHVFEYRKIKGEYIWVPIGTSFYEIKFQYNPLDYTEGDKVLLKIDDNNNAELIRAMDDPNSLTSVIKAQAYDYGLRVEFPEEVLKEADEISTEITQKDIDERMDLRHLRTITMDPLRAQDLDDAVSLEITPQGYRLYVSSADVSHYVKPGMKIFAEALKRGVSIYPGNMVVPLFPPRISNEICSLSPNGDKLAKTMILDIVFDGNVIDRRFVKSIINSNYKMVYDDVNLYLEDGQLKNDYIQYKEYIDLMNNVSDLIEAQRLKRGYITLETETQDFIFDDHNNLIGIKSHKRGPAQNIIENFMLIANENVTDMARILGILYIFRDHECPDIEKLYTIGKSIPGFNKYIKTLSNAQSPKLMQQIINSMLKGKTDQEKKHLSKIILRGMPRAYYSCENRGHFGLGLDSYGTFTSPIRKLSDFLDHTVWDYVLEGRADELDKFNEYFPKWAEICTQKQYEAEKFEESIDGMLLQDLAYQYYGQILNGTILFRSDDYVYIDTQVGFYGYIKLNKKSYENGDIIINNESYKVGSSIDVMINNVDTLSNEIEFKAAKVLDKDQAVLKRIKKEGNKNDKY